MRDGAGTTAYAYDPRGNLATQTVTLGSVTHALSYAYDGADRLNQIRNGFPEDYGYAADSHHLLQAGMRSYRYDANGNTTGTSDLEFVYGDHNRLTAVIQAGVPLARYAYNGRGERVTKLVGEDPPDYAALAAEQEALATAHRGEAGRTEAKVQTLEGSAQALETQAAQKHTEADTLRQVATTHRTAAEGLDRQAIQREQPAASWRTLAQRFRSRIVEPPQNPRQRRRNARYRASAKRSAARAAAISTAARRLRVDAVYMLCI